MAQQGHCHVCGLAYQVVCPVHPDVMDQVYASPLCYFSRCSAEKHIIIPCACDPDLWEVEALLDPDAECCAIGVCSRHEECERHGHCPDPSLRQGAQDEEDPCQYEYVGQCTSFFLGPKGERGRCSHSLDGVADSNVCPDCVRRYYPRPLCDTCTEPRRWMYDGMAGAWLRQCPCNDESSSSGSEEKQGPQDKKQKVE